MKIETKKSICANYLTNKEFLYLLSKGNNNKFKKFQILSFVEVIVFYFIVNLLFDVNQLEYLGYITAFSFIGYISIKFNIFKLGVITKIVNFTDNEFKNIKYKYKTYIGYLLNCYSFFWVLLFVFLFKSFLYENFIIPSSSMKPTLNIGEMVYVNKFSNEDVIKGDVIVFKSPIEKSTFYIKRVIGVSGDKIDVSFNDIIVNDKNIKGELIGNYPIKEFSRTSKKEVIIDSKLYQEGDYNIIEINKNDDIFKDNFKSGKKAFPIENMFNASDYCSTNGDNQLSCTIPEDKYFVLGDNRDNSLDSRFWGFVDKSEIVGKVKYKNFLSEINTIKHIEQH